MCRTPMPGLDGGAPAFDERVDRVEAGGVGEAVADPFVELVEGAERAGDDDQPAARPHPGGEGAQDARGGEVVRLGHRVDLGGRIGVRAHPRGGVGEDDVDLAQLGGERGDRAGVADVEDPWPGLTERPDVRYVVRDWWAKLQI